MTLLLALAAIALPLTLAPMLYPGRPAELRDDGEGALPVQRSA